MEKTVKKQKKKPSIVKAEQAFAAMFAISAISLTAVLITLFFVISTLYFNDDLWGSEDMHNVLKEMIGTLVGELEPT